MKTILVTILLITSWIASGQVVSFTKDIAYNIQPLGQYFGMQALGSMYYLETDTGVDYTVKDFIFGQDYFISPSYSTSLIPMAFQDFQLNSVGALHWVGHSPIITNSFTIQLTISPPYFSSCSAVNSQGMAIPLSGVTMNPNASHPNGFKISCVLKVAKK